MPKIRKKTSKRQSLSRTHKIEKNVREHHRKIKKEAKKRRELGIVPKGKKEPGIPNLYPYKEELINQLERQNKREQNEKLVEKLRKKKEKDDITNSSLENLVAEVHAKVEKYEEEKKSMQDDDESNFDHNNKKTSLSKKMYLKELDKVIEEADVILEILDARDPIGCRNEKMEYKVQSKNKKIILVINKIDLIPKENAKAWLSYFRREHPTILFKCNTQSQTSSLSSTSLHKSSLTNREELVDDLLSSSKSVGADNLLQLLKNYCRSDDIKKTITVGVVGFPNVGKSSLINSLKRSKVVGVADTPGFTKSIQEIHLDKNIKLLDSPGVILSKDNTDSIILRNAVKVEDLSDPYQPVNTILKKVDKTELLKVYEIADFTNIHDFLALIAKKRGKLMKGGVPDHDKAARLVLHDWNQGKIFFYTNPPDVSSTSMEIDE